MPTKSVRTKRRNKKPKRVENRQPTAMSRSRYSENAVRKMADYNVSNTAIVIYLYINLNCSLSSGVGHELQYDEIIDYFGWRPETVYDAIIELEHVGLITVAKRGGIIPDIPDQRHIQQLVHVDKYEKQAKAFYTAFQERITDKEFERGRSLDKSVILRMYDDFVEECGRERKWKPAEKYRDQLFNRLQMYAPLE